MAQRSMVHSVKDWHLIQIYTFEEFDSHTQDGLVAISLSFYSFFSELFYGLGELLLVLLACAQQYRKLHHHLLLHICLLGSSPKYALTLFYPTFNNHMGVRSTSYTNTKKAAQNFSYVETLSLPTYIHQQMTSPLEYRTIPLNPTLLSKSQRTFEQK